MTTDLATLANAAPAGPRPKQCGANYAIETAHDLDPVQGELLKQAINNPHAPTRAVAEAIRDLIGFRIQTQTITRHRGRGCACKETK